MSYHVTSYYRASNFFWVTITTMTPTTTLRPISTTHPQPHPYLSNILLFPPTLQFFHPYLVPQVHFPNQLRFSITRHSGYPRLELENSVLKYEASPFIAARLHYRRPFDPEHLILSLLLPSSHLFLCLRVPWNPNLSFIQVLALCSHIYIFLVGYYATRYHLYWVLCNPLLLTLGTMQPFTTFWVLCNPVSPSLVRYCAATSFSIQRHLKASFFLCFGIVYHLCIACRTLSASFFPW